MFGKTSTMKYTENFSDKIERLREKISEAEAIVIGAGAGLSTSAGFVYDGERFQKFFFDFAEKYSFKDMYYGGFYPYPSKEEFWAYWSRYIYINRYMDPPKPIYDELFELVKDKDYFVLTTNVDHCFQKAGFDKKRLFYTQGDYGLFQSVNPDIQKTYNNREFVLKAMETQGFILGEDGIFEVPSDRNLKMTIPTELIPKCPDDGSDMTTNLRADDGFVQDEGWYEAAERYEDFLRTRSGKILYLELGVGFNTPGIIKYPFWQRVLENEEATFVCLNCNQAGCPDEIKDRSICIDGDIGEILEELMK